MFIWLSWLETFRTKSRHYVFLPLKKIFSFFNDAILKERNTKNTVELQPIKLIYKCKISLISKMVWKTPSWVLVIFQWMSANPYVQWVFFYMRRTWNVPFYSNAKNDGKLPKIFPKCIHCTYCSYNGIRILLYMILGFKINI